jgi:hypothetical protein
VAEQPARQHDLLLVAAGELAGDAVGVVRDRVELAQLSRGGPPLSARAQQGAPGEAAQVRDRHVLGERPVEQEALRLAVLRREPEAGGDRRGGAPGGEPSARDADLAGAGVVEAVDQAQQLGPAGADEAADADHFAGADLERRVADVAPAAEAANLQNHLARGVGPLGEQLLDLAADHELDQPGRRGVGRQAGGHRAAVRQHRHAVSDPGDLVQAMRDVDHADAVRAEPPDDAEQRLDLVVVEDRGGLVHDEQADPLGQGARDRDDLLAGGPQRSHERVGRYARVVEPREQRGGLAPHAPAVEQPTPVELVAEEDALRHGQVLDEVELLVDRGDAARERSARLALRQRLAVDPDLALRRRDRAGHALDQRRLARAVGPEHAVDLARPHVEVDAVQGAHARVLLGDAADLEHRRVGGRCGHRVAARVGCTATSTQPPFRVDSSTASTIWAERRPSAKTGMPSAGSPPRMAS